MCRGQRQLSVSPPKLPMPVGGGVDEPHVLDLELGDLEVPEAPRRRTLTVQRKPPASHAAVRSLTRRSTRSKRLRSSSFGSILPVIASVTSLTETVT